MTVAYHWLLLLGIAAATVRLCWLIATGGEHK